MNVDINPCYDSVQSNNQKTRMTMNPSYETVQNSTSDQLHIQTRQKSHYENVNPHSAHHCLNKYNCDT